MLRGLRLVPILVVFMSSAAVLWVAFPGDPAQGAQVSAEQSFEAALSTGNGPGLLLEGKAVDSAVPVPSEFLGFELCSRAAPSRAINDYLKRLAEASPRIQVRKYGETYEGRELCYAVISSEENMQKLEAVKDAISLLADPRRLKGQDSDRLLRDTPAVAWLEFSIHGDELSGADAALFLAYYLVAAQDSLTRAIRDNMIVVIDPNQNPDGRERFLGLLSQWASTGPNPDNQSVEHSTFWPWGRGNHYLFDLNRDWLPFLLRETQSRAAAILDWHPQLVVDAHEMGAFETFLFSPPSVPLNPNRPASLEKWLRVFGEDQAKALDKFGWGYYTGEWNEEWGPFYANTWASHTGAIGILYEQAGVEGTGVRRPDGTYLGYPEAVLHHVVSSIANLSTAASHRKEILSDFYNQKKSATTGGEKKGGREGGYIVADTGNRVRMAKLVTLLQRHGIEVHSAEAGFVARDLTRSTGEKLASKKFPAGTYLLPFAQPMGSLLKTIFEFDPRMTTSFLEQERDELEKRGETKLYEVTAWSVPLAFDVEAYEALSWGPVATQKLEAPEQSDSLAAVKGEVVNDEATYGFLVDYGDDAASLALPRLFEKGCEVKVAMKPFKTAGRQFSRGTLLVPVSGNPEGLVSILQEVARSTGARFYGVSSAWTEEGPDLGGNYVRLLHEPRVAILTGAEIDFSAFGVVWYLLDREYRCRFSTVDIGRLERLDLDKYNVIILPPIWGSHTVLLDVLGKRNVAKIRRWVENQGTLICIGAAAAFAADTTSGLSKVRLRRQSLELLDEFTEAVAREDAAKGRKLVDSLAVWEGKPPKEGKRQVSKSAVSTQADAQAGPKPGSKAAQPGPGAMVGGAPAAGSLAGKPDVEKLKREDEWVRRFMPRGAILRADVDQEHWLGFGLGEEVPVSLYTECALLSMPPVETVCRLSEAGSLRMSGLLWPEAKKRWAKTAYATRESVGRGQIILFAGEPDFRGYFRGTGRIFANAIFLGPGLGTSIPVPW
jgi:hypothetical protein